MGWVIANLVEQEKVMEQIVHHIRKAERLQPKVGTYAAAKYLRNQLAQLKVPEQASLEIALKALTTL